VEEKSLELVMAVKCSVWIYEYAKYSYTIVSDQLLKLNPRLIMFSFTFL